MSNVAHHKFIYFNKRLYPEIDRQFLNFLTFKIFLGKLIKAGKRKKAFTIIGKVFFMLKKRFPRIKYIFFYIVYMLMPILKLVNKRVGGVIYKLPKAITNPKIAISIAIKTLLTYSAKRKEKNFYVKLVNEMIETLKKKSASYKSKAESYMIAAGNLPFLHYLRKRKNFNNRYNKYKMRKRYKYKLYSFKKPKINNLKFVTFLKKRRFINKKKLKGKRR